MTRRGFATACWVLLFAISASAQSGGAKADPVSGTWTGSISLSNASDPIPIRMELKFDGKSAVTGTFSGLPSPGDVKHGTFNPKTGALTLELGKTSGSDVLLTFEGTLANAVASGRISGEAGDGQFKITKKV